MKLDVQEAVKQGRLMERKVIIELVRTLQLDFEKHGQYVLAAAMQRVIDTISGSRARSDQEEQIQLSIEEREEEEPDEPDPVSFPTVPAQLPGHKSYRGDPCCCLLCIRYREDRARLEKGGALALLSLHDTGKSDEEA